MSVSLIYLRGSGVENVRGGWSWVRGVILESDGGRLSWIIVRTKANEDFNDNIRTSIKYMSCLLFKRLYAAGLVYGNPFLFNTLWLKPLSSGYPTIHTITPKTL